MKFEKASPFFFLMFSDRKNAIFEREIKIFYAALLFKTIFTFQTLKKT